MAHILCLSEGNGKMALKISEVIEALVKAKRKHGDIDLVWINQQQFCDTTDIQIIDKDNCPKRLQWCYSGPVAVVNLDIG